MVKRGNHAVTEVLVEWVNSFPEDATWEPLPVIQTNFLGFFLEDKEAFAGGKYCYEPKC